MESTTEKQKMEVREGQGQAETVEGTQEAGPSQVRFMKRISR